MMSNYIILLLALIFTTGNSFTIEENEITIVSFEKGKNFHAFRETNDPVMGGESYGNFTISNDGYAKFQGKVVDVPSLKAPGFIKAQTSENDQYPDISSCNAITLNARSSAKYDGYRFSFGDKKGLFCSFFASGFKAKFEAPVSNEFQAITIPLNKFSDCNSDSTGEPTKTCEKDKAVCPDKKSLQNLKTVAIWAEGALGVVDLDIKSIVATGCSNQANNNLRGSENKVELKSLHQYVGNYTCSGKVQANLRFNMSGRTSVPDWPFSLAPGETLVEAVCCDSAFAAFAEPRNYYTKPDVDFFAKLSTQAKPVTFYDSVCGIPLFTVPQNRTWNDFIADTTEHGWPSFRPAEVVADNVKILSNNYVVSKCGTHLGSNLPDNLGIRYCLDLSCVSGNNAN